MNYPFRIFLSYARDDLEFVKRVIIELEILHCKPLVDQSIRPGIAFTPAIKDLISQSHIFMPILTENSMKSYWVHQETGYALALNIPVIPLAVGVKPGEMTANLQAITIKEDMSDLKNQLEIVDFDKVVIPPPQMPDKLIDIIIWPEKRTEMLVENTKRVIELGIQTGEEQEKSPWMIRQRAVLSSFSIPKNDISDEIWKRYDGKSTRSDYYHDLVRRERENFEYLSGHYGVKLILDFEFVIPNRGTDATIVRLEVLRDFLEGMPDDKVEIISSDTARKGNLVIVGNWFFAESMIPRDQGYHQTIFNWQAPVVLGKIREFDKQFEDEKLKGKILPLSDAIKRLDKRISDLIKTLEKEDKTKKGDSTENQ